jgi:hypothetical protein
MSTMRYGKALALVLLMIVAMLAPTAVQALNTGKLYVAPGPLQVKTSGGVNKFLVAATGVITLANSETIDNSTNGTIKFTSPVLNHYYDSTDYMTITLANNTGPVLDSVCTGGTPQFTFSDPVLAPKLALTQTATSGYGLSVSRNLASGSTDSPVLYVLQDNASDDQPALQIKQDASANIITGIGTSAATVFEVTSAGAVKSLSGAGAIVADKCTAAEYGDGTVHQTVLTLTLTGDNDIDVGDGGKTAGVKVYDFPEGRIAILGATINADTVTNNVYNASTNDIYYVGVGTVDGTQAANADLTGTEQDIIPKTTLDTVSSTDLDLAWHNALSATAQWDGTTTAVDVYVNVAVPDASNTGATTHDIQGTLTITWVNLGDY